MRLLSGCFSLTVDQALAKPAVNVECVPSPRAIPADRQNMAEIGSDVKVKKRCHASRFSSTLSGTTWRSHTTERNPKIPPRTSWDGVFYGKASNTFGFFYHIRQVYPQNQSWGHEAAVVSHRHTDQSRREFYSSTFPKAQSGLILMATFVVGFFWFTSKNFPTKIFALQAFKVTQVHIANYGTERKSYIPCYTGWNF